MEPGCGKDHQGFEDSKGRLDHQGTDGRYCDGEQGFQGFSEQFQSVPNQGFSRRKSYRNPFEIRRQS